MSETWEKELCPSCQVANWYPLGDLEDQTIPDTTSFKCWKCKKSIHIFTDEFKTELGLHVEGEGAFDDVDNGREADGLEHPR